MYIKKDKLADKTYKTANQGYILLCLVVGCSIPGI